MMWVILALGQQPATSWGPIQKIRADYPPLSLRSPVSSDHRDKVSWIDKDQFARAATASRRRFWRNSLLAPENEPLGRTHRSRRMRPRGRSAVHNLSTRSIHKPWLQSGLPPHHRARPHRGMLIVLGRLETIKSVVFMGCGASAPTKAQIDEHRREAPRPSSLRAAPGQRAASASRARASRGAGDQVPANPKS